MLNHTPSTVKTSSPLMLPLSKMYLYPSFVAVKSVVAVSSPDPVLISFFRDNQGVRYMAAVNLSRSISRHVLFTFASSVTPYQRLFTRQYAKLSTNADPVAERDAGGRQPHRAGRYLAPGQLLLVKLHRNAQNYDL